MHTSINEMIKSLFKEKTMAKLVKYQAGQIFYQFILGNATYEFAIDTITKSKQEESEPYDTSIKLSEDLGTTAFLAEVRASELTRWIKKAAMISELKKL